MLLAMIRSDDLYQLPNQDTVKVVTQKVWISCRKMSGTMGRYRILHIIYQSTILAVLLYLLSIAAENVHSIIVDNSWLTEPRDVDLRSLHWQAVIDVSRTIECYHLHRINTHKVM